MQLKETIQESFKIYAGTVILDRAICDARDMLKPSARMLLYSQKTLTKNSSNKPFIKSAKVIGDALGNFYPHGDSSCYNIYMRMCKPFAMRYPLENCQGNSGTLASTTDHAAMRYTELRLSPLGDQLFDDLDKETIDSWVASFDETKEHPKILPSKGFYNIVNGTQGIGVSLASSIPQFNLREINNAMIKLLWNPELAAEQIIVMPDFATGATILNGEQVRQGLINGVGPACILQATVKYNSKNSCFEITELPYGVYTDTLTSQIQNLLEESPNCGIKGINDGSNTKADYLIYIDKNANPNAVLKLLYKKTSLQNFYSINMTVLKDGKKPVVMGLKELLLEHLEHEKRVYRRGYEFDLRKINKRLNIIEGLLICNSNIQEIISIIKTSDSSSAAAIILQQKYLLNEDQTKAILAMRLSSLVHLEVQKLQDEKNELLKNKQSIQNILNDETLFKKEIEHGLQETINKYGDARRTKILNTSEINNEEIETKKEPIFVYVDSKNNLKTVNLQTFKATRGTKGTTLDKTLKFGCRCETGGYILAVNTAGESQAIATDLIPSDTNSTSIINCTNLENPSNIFWLQNKKYVIVVTSFGNVHKTLMEEYNFLKKGRLLKLKENEIVQDVLFANEDDNVVMITKTSKLLNIPVKNIKLSNKMTYGVSYGEIISSAIVDSGLIIVYNKKNKGFLTPYCDLPTHNRTNSGTTTNEVIGIAAANQQVCILTRDCKLLTFPLKELPMNSLKASGSRLTSSEISKIWSY